jgi:ABC-type amino acid transport system permease subunit
LFHTYFFLGYLFSTLLTPYANTTYRHVTFLNNTTFSAASPSVVEEWWLVVVVVVVGIVFSEQLD